MDQLTFDRTADRRRKRRRALVAVLLSSSLATLGAGAMSLAVFTDSQATDGTWSTGTIDIAVDAGVSFTASDILPGDTGAKDISVENNGTGELRYAVTTSASDDGSALADQINLVIIDGTCGSGSTTELYDGPLADAAIGSPAQGDDGEPVVISGGTDDLCFRWTFPLGSGNAYQDTTTTATFTFDAEQTSNNP